MHTRRTLLISGAATVVTALLPFRAMASQRRLAPLKPGARIRAVNPGTWMDPNTICNRCSTAVLNSSGIWRSQKR